MGRLAKIKYSKELNITPSGSNFSAFKPKVILTAATNLNNSLMEVPETSQCTLIKTGAGETSASSSLGKPNILPLLATTIRDASVTNLAAELLIVLRVLMTLLINKLEIPTTTIRTTTTTRTTTIRTTTTTQMTHRKMTMRQFRREAPYIASWLQ